MAPKRKHEDLAHAPPKQPSKPKDFEFVGSGSPMVVLNSDTLPQALAHLGKAADNNEQLCVLLSTGDSLLFAPARKENAAFIYLCEF